MSEPTPPAAAPVSEEFFLRVNDVLQMANRIERRFDSGHAQVVLLHAFSRYGAHHFLSTVKNDSAEERAAFANYLGNGVADLVRQHIEHLSANRPPAAGAPAADAAGEPAAE